MTYSISISGHVTEQESDGTMPQTPAQIEAELAVKLHELLSEPKYGLSAAQFWGQHIGGPVNLAATVTPAAGDDDQDDGDSGEDPAPGT